MPWAADLIYHPSFKSLLEEHSQYYILFFKNECSTNISDWPTECGNISEVRTEIETRGLVFDFTLTDTQLDLYCWVKKAPSFDTQINQLLHRLVLGQDIPLGDLEARFSELDDALVVDIGDEFLFSYLISLVQRKFNAEVGLLQIFTGDTTINMALGFNANDLEQITYNDIPLRQYLDEHRMALVFPDVTQEPNLVIKNRNPGLIKSMLITPVVNKGKMVALLCLVNKNTSSEDLSFTLKDKNLLSSMSVSIGSSITNALLYQETTELKEFNEQVLENMPVGILTLSTQHEVLFMNRYLRELLEKTGFGQDDLFSSIEGGDNQEFFNREFYLEKGDNGLYLRVSKRFLQIGVSQPVFLYTISDISLEKEFELQMRRTERLAVAGELIAGIAHEIKNPLTSMKGFTDLLWKRIDDKEFVLKFASIVGSEINRLNTIIERFQSFARPQIGEMSEIELSTLVKEMSEIVTFNLDRNHIVLTNQVKPGIKINGTRDLILQVLINIMLNASQALAESEKDSKNIAIFLDLNKDYVDLVVEDNGPGIEEKNITRIFDPFYTTKPKGSGLGLSISHRIMQEHNGSINIESKPGKFTRVILRFPIHLEKDSK